MVVCSVTDGKFEWEGENHVPFFVSYDECASVRFMPIKNALAHALASGLRSFLANCFHVGKFDTFVIEHCGGFVFAVEEITWHRLLPVFYAERAICAERVGSRRVPPKHFARLRTEQNLQRGNIRSAHLIVGSYHLVPSTPMRGRKSGSGRLRYATPEQYR